MVTILFGNEAINDDKATYAESAEVCGQRRASGCNADCDGDISEPACGVVVVNESCGV